MASSLSVGLPSSLGEGKAIAFDMLDDAGAFDLRRRIDDAGEDALDRQIVGDDTARIDAFEPRAFMCAAVFEEIPPRDAVLRREHAGLRPIDRRQIAHDGGDLMRLHAENDEILRADIGDTIRGFDLRDGFLVAFNQFQAVGVDRCEMRPAGDDADFFAGIGELRREQAAESRQHQLRIFSSIETLPASSLTSAVTPEHIWRVNAASQMVLSTLAGA